MIQSVSETLLTVSCLGGGSIASVTNHVEKFSEKSCNWEKGLL